MEKSETTKTQRHQDYKRNGTTRLFAALNVAEGTVIGTCHPRHRNEEFLKLPRKIDRETPKDMAPHLILDNFQTAMDLSLRLSPRDFGGRARVVVIDFSG